MPVPTRVHPEKNIWVAAGDGDLTRVQVPISPNAPDPYTYTPMHAAASYAQLAVLEYLVSRGGDVNITDDDGDTPLYTVETVETARWLVEHGATVDRENNEGVAPIDHLEEDFPEVAAYLRSSSNPAESLADALPHLQPSQHQQNAASESLTSTLMQSVQDIMHRAEAEGRDPESELREAVSRTVLEGVLTGYEMTTDGAGTDNTEASNGVKRPKLDDS
ncbi:hypothetical protein BV22DRAFT_1001143 [Leucogyrophana mollusca]|uniref:Uncharacterized protein n=1 Tax=Leucogyrophana mollusca TaxID=85980 RepID=A0ACB8BW34_9AGAM|nr:hypothetical protein BV22DRAFT_1001143 [Leucogyrophana mollusca]